MLKLGVPDPEHNSEIAALRVYGGQGAVRLEESDPEGCALLLERLIPGEMLSTLTDDDEATRIAAGVMHRLWRPTPTEHGFPHLDRWTRSLQRLRPDVDGGTGPLPADLIARAQALLQELLASAAEPVLLHGDLHHFNILRAEREPWLAIDPKGIVGEPAFDTGTLLLNPRPDMYAWPNVDRILRRRIAILAETLSLDHERIRAWAFVEAMLSASWTAEDERHGWEPAVALAEQFAALHV
ncbi:MAG: aminoglycoside phosphotransferase family protein [Dehalococcoidia bacterium]